MFCRRSLIVAVAAAAVAVAQPPSHSDWTLTFEDTFDGTTLDGTKWDKGFGWGMNSGAFLENNDPANVTVQDGNLVIKVENRASGGSNWTSGAVNTKNHFSQHKGYFEARIKCAKGSGFINAFWSKCVTEAWPPEIDFVEVLGKGGTNNPHYTVHFNEVHAQKGFNEFLPVDLSQDYHVYGCEWSDNEFIWYVDGVERYRNGTGHSWITGFNGGCAFYMMLNVHVVCKDAPQWTGWPDGSNVWPAYMKVDWVRAWKKGPPQQTPPSITGQPADATVAEGKNVTFRVSATGAIPRTCQWYRDGQAIDGATNDSYTLSGVKSTDSGSPFKAEVANQYGKAMSEEAVLTVTDFDGVSVARTSSTPAVDGMVDNCWNAAPPYPITNVIAGTVSSAGDLSGEFRTLWDAQALYLLVTVVDDIKKGSVTTAGELWKNDAVELYIDGDNSRTNSYDASDRLYRFIWNRDTFTEEKNGRTEGVVAAQQNTASGYTIEVKLPLSTCAVPARAGAYFGIDVHINDSDSDGNRDGKIAWKTTVDDTWRDPSLMGTALLREGATAVSLSRSTATGSRADFTVTGRQILAGRDVERVEVFEMSGKRLRISGGQASGPSTIALPAAGTYVIRLRTVEEGTLTGAVVVR